MGANDKHEAVYHGGEYGAILDSSRLHYALSKDPGNGRTIEEWWAVKDEAFKDFDRAIAKIKAEAKAEALNEAAAEIDRLESIGDTARNQVSEDQEKDYWRFHGTPITDWLRDRVNQYKEAPSA